MSQFAEVADSPSGKKASQVADLLNALVEAKGKPRSYEEMCKELGIKYPGDLQPAMHSLEFVGAVARFTCVEKGSKRKKVKVGLQGFPWFVSLTHEKGRSISIPPQQR